MPWLACDFAFTRALKLPSTYLIKNKKTIYYKSRRFISEPHIEFSEQKLERACLTKYLKNGKDNRFLYSLDVFSEELTNKIGEIVQHIISFDYFFAVLGGVIAIATALAYVASVYTYYPIHVSPTLLDGTASKILTPIGMMFLLVFHEFGHVAACRKVGIRADCIGTGFYLFFPTFYTKLSLIKLLNKRERVIVFSSGIYIQLLFSIIIALTAILTRERYFLNILHLNNAVILINALPVFSFDGKKALSEYVDEIRSRGIRRLLSAIFTFFSLIYFAIVIRALFTQLDREVTLLSSGEITIWNVAFSSFLLVSLAFFLLSVPKLLRSPFA